MNNPWSRLAGWIRAEQQAALVTITAIRGSSPREAGTRMIVRRDGQIGGTIGGGTLEWQAIALAQQVMARHPEGHGQTRGFALGPDMGQCCGGHVSLRIEALALADLTWLETLAAHPMAEIIGMPDPRGILIRQPRCAGDIHAGPASIEPGLEAPTALLLFGAGHVGRALVLALAPLPFAIRWIDTRRELFPSHQPANVTAVATLDPVAEIASARPGSLVLAMTHSHALDLELMAAALQRPDLPLVGVIGSATKRARFLSQLRQHGLAPEQIDRMICPIGLPDLGSKAPAVIAAGICVQLLQHRAALAATVSAAPLIATSASG